MIRLTVFLILNLMVAITIFVFLILEIAVAFLIYTTKRMGIVS